MILFTLLSGCRTVWQWSECDRYSYDIGDDDPAAQLGVTPAEVLDTVVGAFAFTAAYDDGTPVTGHGEVARGAGSAVVTDATRDERESRRGFGFVRYIVSTSSVTCDDVVEIPVEVALQTDDGQIDLTLDGVATTTAPPRAFAPPEGYQVWGEVDDADAIALPLAPDEAAWAEVAVQWPTAGGPPWVSLWWAGADRYVQLLESVEP